MRGYYACHMCAVAIPIVPEVIRVLPRYRVETAIDTEVRLGRNPCVDNAYLYALPGVIR